MESPHLNGKDDQPKELKRALGLWDLTAFGVASIMGSGGFNLISKGVIEGGPWFPVALLLVALLFMGASKIYEEAYKLYKSNTTESDIVRDQIGQWAADLVSVSIMGFNVYSISTILVYAAQNIFPNGSWTGQVGFATLILSAMTGFSLKGIELNKSLINFFSATIIAILTFATGIGLVQGFGPSGTPPDAFPSVLKTTPNFVQSILFFYFTLSGFDDNMKFVEEAKNPDQDIPKSFYLSNGISAALTAGVAYAFVHVLTLMRKPPSQYVTNALGVIIESALGKPSSQIVYVLGIFLMLTTAFVSFLAGSRYLYSLVEDTKGAEAKEWLKWLDDLNSNNVPWRAILLSSGLVVSGLLLNHTQNLVRISDFFLTLVMFTVGAAVTKARWTKGEIPWIEGLTTAGFAGLLSTCCIPW